MNLRKPLIVLGLAGAVAAIVVVGTAFAQTPTPNNQQTKTNYHQFFLDRLANALGTTGDKLTSALTQARNETVDQEVKDGKLSQEQADKIKAQQGNVPFFFGFRGFDRNAKGGMVFLGGSQVRDAIAKALGITTDDLTNQLRSGKTLADLAKGKEQAVKDAVVNAEKAILDQAVKDGKMTQDRANQILDKIQKADLNNLFARGGFRHDGEKEGRMGRPHAGKTPTSAPKQ